MHSATVFNTVGLSKVYNVRMVGKLQLRNEYSNSFVHLQLGLDSPKAPQKASLVSSDASTQTASSDNMLADDNKFRFGKCTINLYFC